MLTLFNGNGNSLRFHEVAAAEWIRIFSDQGEGYVKIDDEFLKQVKMFNTNLLEDEQKHLFSFFFSKDDHISIRIHLPLFLFPFVFKQDTELLSIMDSFQCSVEQAERCLLEDSYAVLKPMVV